MKLHSLVELFTAVLIGICISRFSSTQVLGLVFGIIFTLIVIRWPVLGILGLVLSTSSIMYHGFIQIPVVGHYQLALSDVLLVVLVFSYMLRRAFGLPHNTFRSPLTPPMLAALLVVVLVALQSVLRFGVLPGYVLAGARGYLYYALFFPVLGLVYKPAQVRFLVRALLATAIFVSLLMAAQAFLGPDERLFLGHQAVLRLEFGREGDIRLIPPGLPVLILSLFYCTVRAFTTKPSKNRILMLVIAVICSAGLAMTMTRVVWMGCLLSLAFAAVYFHRQGGLRLLTLPLIIVTLLLTTMLLSQLFLAGTKHPGARTVQRYVERFYSIFQAQEYRTESSLGYRWREYQVIKPYVEEHFLFGFGFGNPYHFVWNPYTNRRNLGSFYVHNGLLAVLLPMGIGGLIAFSWLFYNALVYCTRKLSQMADPFAKSLILTTYLTLLALIVTLLAQPTLSEASASPVLALLLGLTVLTARQSEWIKSPPPVAPLDRMPKPFL